MGPLRLLRGFIARAAGAAFLLRAFMHRPTHVAGIAIYGPPIFRDAVAAAVRLLNADAPDAFAFCARFIDTVVLSRHSAVTARRRPAIMMLGAWATSVSTPYLASTLAHEAFHCNLYWSHRESGGKRSSHIESGVEAERQCLEYQITVLRVLGGTDVEASHLANQLSTEWWKVPLHERTW